MRDNRQRHEASYESSAKSGVMLAAAAVICSVIIMLYRIPLADIIGTEGVSYYTSAYAFYNIILIVSSYALPIAVSKLISVRLVSGRYEDAVNVFRTAMIYATVFGAAFFLIFSFGAPLIARLTDRGFLSYALKALAPAVWLMAYLGVFRGYFQGMGSVKPTAFSQVVEQLVNAVFSIIFAVYMSDYGYKADLIYDETAYTHAYGAAGATYGVSCGALVALILLFILYRGQRAEVLSLIRNTRAKRREAPAHIRGVLGQTALPVILGAVFFNITFLLDDFIFNTVLQGSWDGLTAVEVWGVFGKFAIIFYILQMTANAPGAAMIPEISAGAARRDKKKIVLSIRGGMRSSMAFAIPVCAGIAALSEPICRLLFGPDNIELLKNITALGALFILLFCLATVSNAVLQGLGHVGEPLLNSISALIVHIALLFVLGFVAKLGIYAVVISNIAFAAIMCITDNICIKRHVRFKKHSYDVFIKPLISSVAAGISVYILHLIYKLIIPDALYATRIGVLPIAAGGAFIFVFIYAFISAVISSRKMR